MNGEPLHGTQQNQDTDFSSVTIDAKGLQEYYTTAWQTYPLIPLIKAGDAMGKMGDDGLWVFIRQGYSAGHLPASIVTFK